MEFVKLKFNLQPETLVKYFSILRLKNVMHKWFIKIHYLINLLIRISLCRKETNVQVYEET